MHYRALLLLTTLAIAGCSSTPQTVKASFETVLRPCADIPDGLLYLGPTNVFGPGSVWRKVDSLDYRVRWSLAQVDADAIEAVASKGSPISCIGEKSATLSVNPEVALPSAIASAPISAEIGLDVTRASKATVSVAEIRIDTVEELEFEIWAREDQTDSYRKDLDQPNRLVMTSAVRVDGYRAVFEFSPAVAGQLGASAGEGVTPPGVTGNMTARWTSDTKLTVEAKQPFYIAGELTRILPGRVFGSTASANQLPLMAQVAEMLPAYAVASADDQQVAE